MDQSALKEKVRRLPHSSGVYIMKDALGSVIYIGKAYDLKRRVSQYFTQSYKTRAYNRKVASLAECIADFDFINTRSEAEALILESKLIKEWKPRYNTLEKDNKNFLLLRVEAFAPLPRFTLARNRKEDNSLYFGPYLGSTALRSALNEMTMVAEGYFAADCIRHINTRHRVEMPIAEMVYRVLYERASARKEMQALTTKLI